VKFLDRFNLNPRERKLVQALIVVLAVLFVLGVPVGLESWVSSKREENQALRDAIDNVQAARGTIRERQAKKDAIAQRYQNRAPELAAYLEAAAKKQKLDITDSVDRPPVPIGKRYTERSTTIHLKKAGMLALSRFIESIEQSGSPVAVTRLNIRRRMGEPDSYDVELGVSAWDRAEKETPAPAASTGAKP
jgi:general secretion pathway protein M